ncbi:MAG: hypothetical protein MJ236_02505 [Clostridia bacterium]|nr:hypothetical protein [Clostridia bacterium]
MASLNLLYAKEYKVNDYITIKIPTVGEVLEDEDGYYGLVTLLTAMPYDLMVELDDMGIDFSEINDWDLFLIVFQSLKLMDTSLVFGDLDLSKFELAVNTQNNHVVLRDSENEIVIDRAIQNQIACALRKIHHLEKNNRKPGNKEARDFLLERARTKRKRNRNRKSDSQLESLIIAMVNTEQFKYNYETVKDMTIYQFNESVKQIVHKVAYDQRMVGVYSGTISSNDLSQDDFNWLDHK